MHDFISRAEKLAQERGWTMTQAFSHLSHTEPELYEAYLMSIGAGHVLEARRKSDEASGGRRGAREKR